MRRARPAKPCRRSASTLSSIRSAHPASIDLTAHVDFAALAHGVEAMGPTAYGADRSSAIAAPSRHRDARRHAQDQGDAHRRRRNRQRAGAADRRGPHRHGRAVQGDGLRPPIRWRAARIRVKDAAMLQSPSLLQAPSLSRLARIRHGFFTRGGGVSQGVYASLNGGVGSNDTAEKVAENRARMAAALGVAPDRLLTAYQIHSPDVVTVEMPWTKETRPRADAMVTRTAKLALGVSTADCGPLLFADAQAGVIGAAHAGWRGALSGVIEATVAAMEKLGAKRGHIAAALGPVIRQANYEVGAEFVDRFIAADAAQRALLCAGAECRPRIVRPCRSYRRAHSTERHHAIRRSRSLHLCRARAFLQLPPHDASGRAGLRPAYQCHLVDRLTFRRSAPRPRKSPDELGRLLAVIFRPGRGELRARIRPRRRP